MLIKTTYRYQFSILGRASEKRGSRGREKQRGGKKREKENKPWSVKKKKTTLNATGEIEERKSS